jgi:hypothetical protein
MTRCDQNHDNDRPSFFPVSLSQSAAPLRKVVRRYKEKGEDSRKNRDLEREIIMVAEMQQW